jgi:hypothetical protein
MYRIRGEKLPPGKIREWWPTSRQFGRGTLAAAAITWLALEMVHVQWLVLMEVRVVDDRASAMEKYCNGRGCLQNQWTQKAFVPVAILAMIVSTRNGHESWPRSTRDLPAAVRANRSQLAAFLCLLCIVCTNHWNRIACAVAPNSV